jgi:NAD(P)-dependent dehydrogenase (short-subunit alcohol dehydrogenase family)
MTLFEGKVVWVTGASSGIGEALVFSFAGKGATVIASSNEPSELERVKERCSGLEGKVFCVAFDLSDTSEIDKDRKSVV